MSTTELSRLRDGMCELGFTEAAHFDLVSGYLALLQNWNRAYNLTGTRDTGALITRHLLDCLSIAPLVDVGPVLDFGSGAGLPGLLLAIVRPQLQFTLLDSIGKKTRFLTQAKIELGLANVEVVEQRLEHWHSPGTFHRITMRAVTPPAAIWSRLQALLSPQGCLLAMQARVDPGELESLRAQAARVQVHELQVPGLAETRSVVAAYRSA